MTYKAHPFAELFPMCSEGQIRELSEDIKLHGQRTPIVIYEGMILDGRNRFDACTLAGVAAKFAEYAGKDPLSFVVSMNVHRRQLTASQRAVVAEKLATMRMGDNQHKKTGCANLHTLQKPENTSKIEEKKDTSQKEAADSMHVSRRTVADVAAIKKAAPEKIAEIERGEKTVHAAKVEVQKEAEAKKHPVKVADLPKDERGRIVPPDLVDTWNRRVELAVLAREISKIKCTVDNAAKAKDPLYGMLTVQTLVPLLEQVRHHIVSEMPFCVCPMCQGKKCKACRNVGLISKFRFQSVPVEFKDAGE